MRLRFLASVAFALALFTPPLSFAQTAPAPFVVRLDSTASIAHYTGVHETHAWRGTSRDVRGRLSLDFADPTQSAISLRLAIASIDSGNRTRDRNMRRLFESADYPEVVFESDSVAVESWGRTARGHAGRWVVHGQLSMRGETHPHTISVEVLSDGDTFSALARFEVSLKQYDVPRPRLFFVPIHEHITLEADLRAWLPEAP